MNKLMTSDLLRRRPPQFFARKRTASGPPRGGSCISSYNMRTACIRRGVSAESALYRAPPPSGAVPVLVIAMWPGGALRRGAEPSHLHDLFLLGGEQ